MNENWLILAVQEQFIGQNQILPTFKGSRPKNQEATVIRIIKKNNKKKHLRKLHTETITELQMDLKK